MDGNKAVVWCGAGHEGPIARAVRASGFGLAALGGAAPDAFDVSEFGAEVELFDDLRATAMAIKPRVLLMTAPPEAGPALDGRTLEALRAAGTQVLTTVAPAPGFLEAGETGLFRESGGSTPASWIRLVPRVRRHPAYVRARDLFEPFGRVNLMTVEAFAPRRAGGLNAALLLAIDAIITVIGVPELTDAAAARPTKRLSELEGSVAALLRFPDGRCGQLMVTDRSSWGWRMTLNSDLGRLTIRPSGFDWVGAEGERHDHTRIDDADAGYTGSIGSCLHAAAEGTLASEPAPDWVGLLSTVEAVLLSSRTGQPESPAMITRASVAGGVS